jgi:PPP family 3-phenylpropionic acid transporter
VRLWGSIGFIASVAALGPVLDQFGVASILPVLLLLMLGIFIVSLLIPESACSVPQSNLEPLLDLFRRPEVVVFLLSCFLMQASHAPYYTFFTIYLGDHGYSNTVIGLLWALGVLCEVGVFLLMPRLEFHIGIRTLLVASFGIAALRWVLIALFPHNLPLLLAAQSLHAVTFGAYHASAVHLVHKFFRGRHQHRGQALYSSVSFGMGGAVGSFYSGYSWMWFGPTQTFMIAAVLAAIAGVAAFVFIRGKG